MNVRLIARLLIIVCLSLTFVMRVGVPSTALAAGVTAQALPADPPEGAQYTGNLFLITELNTANLATCPSASQVNATLTYSDGSPERAATVIYHGRDTTAPNGNCQYMIQETRSYAEEGNVTVTLHYSDPATASGGTFTTTVVVTDAALTGTNTAFAASVGIPVTNQYLGSFQDADPGCLQSDYTLGTVTSTDGGSWSGTSIQPSTHVLGPCTYDVYGTHTFTTKGQYSVSFTVSDAGGAFVTITSAASVGSGLIAAANSGVTATEGTPMQSTEIGSFADTDGSPCSAISTTINWNDGSSTTLSCAGVSSGLQDATLKCTSVNSNLNCIIRSTHVYAEEGTPTAISWSVADSADGQSVNGLSTPLTVKDAALTTQLGNTFTQSALIAFSDQYLGTFQDTNPTCPLSDFTSGGGGATINWGDAAAPGGGTSAGTIVSPSIHAPGPCNFDVYGSYTYQSPGTATVTVTVKDAGGATTTWTDTATVVDRTATLHATGGYFVSGTEARAMAPQVIATFYDTDKDPCTSYKFNINWHDGSSPETNVPCLGGSSDIKVVCQDFQTETSCTVYSTHTYAKSGDYQIDVKIMDTDGATATVSSTANIAEAALSTVSNGADATTIEGVSTKFYLGTFHDDVPAANCPASEYVTTPNSVTVDWGDGNVDTSPPAANITLVKSTRHPGTCNIDIYGTHTYATVNPSISIHTTMDDGGSTADLYASVVVNDAALVPTPSGTPVVLHGTEGTGFPATTVLGTFHDNDPLCPNDFSAKVTWGDATPVDSSATVVPSADGIACDFDVRAGHNYLEEKNAYPIGIAVTSAGGSTTNISASAIIGDAALNALPLATTHFECALLAPCTQTVATFSDVNTSCSNEGESIPVHYAVSINWGDGSPADTTGTVTQRPGTCIFDVTGTHTYTTPTAPGASRAIITTVTDEGGSTVTTSVAGGTAPTETTGTPATVVPPYTGGGNPKVTTPYYHPSPYQPVYSLNESVTYYPSTHSFIGLIAFQDQSLGLKTSNCTTDNPPTTSCRLKVLSMQCSHVSGGPAKTATVWGQYDYAVNNVHYTRFIRVDSSDADPYTHDSFKVTMSSASDPSVAVTSVPPTEPTNLVTITC